MAARQPPPHRAARNAATEAPFLVAFRTNDGGMAVHIDPAGLGSPGAAGLILADLMRHFARALAQAGKAASEEKATAEMLRLFEAEIDHPTDPGSGSIVN